MRHSIVILAAVLLSAALVVSGCGMRQETLSNGSPVADEPATPAGEISLEQAAVERGRYIVEGPGHCFHCHSEIDWSAPRHPQKAGRKGAGTVFPMEGLPGRVVSPNITPDPETGIGQWSDEELAVAIREGVSRDGRRLFPMMPYMAFRNMSDEDLAAVIAYLRTVEPVHNVLPLTELPEPVIQSLPPHVPVTEPVEAPDPSDAVAYGGYLVTLANCVACHTPVDEQGHPMMELAFSGGQKLVGPWGDVASANITPDPSGIPYYDEALFLATMRTCRVRARELNHLMPCEYYKNLTDEDLKAVFAFLGVLEPIQHRVSNTDPPTLCVLCGQMHGLGERN
jgi:mono/diheme cytochrome c family protein